MRNFSDYLFDRIDELNNPTVMGLDPLLSYVPEPILEKWRKKSGDPKVNGASAILEFNCGLIDAACDIVPAVKPQFAYYELYGVAGIQALKETVDYAKSKGMVVIADAKRNDIGSTAAAYADAILGSTTHLDGKKYNGIDADAVTVNAYLGIDGIEPFCKVAKERGKGLFILVRTSNPSAGDFQDLLLEDGTPLYENVARKVEEWGRELIGAHGYSSIGAVVGATWPEQAGKLRRDILRHSPILVPGYGTQGGSGAAAAVNFDRNGKGAIVNASRSLMCAYQKCPDLSPNDYAIATRNEAIRMRDDLRLAIKNKILAENV